MNNYEQIYDMGTTKKSSAKFFITIGIIIAIVVGIIYFQNTSKLTVNDSFVGTWQTSYSNYSAYTETWTFNKNGTYTHEFNYVHYDGKETGFFTTENNILSTSLYRDVKKNPITTYEYAFGTADDGTSCLILKERDYGANKQTIFYRIR